MTAIEVFGNGGVPGAISVFYVDTNDMLAAVNYSVDGTSSIGSINPLVNNTFQVSSTARSLGITRLQFNLSNAYIPGSSPDGEETWLFNDQMFLFYESPDNNITVIQALYTYDGEQSVHWVWSNVSTMFVPNATDDNNINGGGWLSTPFEIAPYSTLDNGS